jgi:hypothetical protein
MAIHDDIVKNVLKNNSFMSLRDPLTKLGYKVDFSFIGAPHYTISKKGIKYIVVNKKYADKPDFTVGDIAFGRE